MATINEFSIWEPNIYELETTDLVIGGPSGISNLSRQQLTNRTRKIYDVLVENGVFITEGDHDFVGQNIDVTAVFEGSVADGDVVWFDNPQSRYEKALANTGTSQEHFVGLADVTNGRVIAGGLVSGVSPAGGTPQVGDILYLSDVTPGQITITASSVPVGKILWLTSPSTAVIALNSGVGGLGGGGFDPEQDTYRMLLNDSFYARGTWDNFENTDLIDGGSTDGDHSFVDQLFELENGEDLVSINLRDPLMSGNVDEAYVSINTSLAGQIWLSADGGANWEVANNNAIHQFSNVGTDLRIWFRASGTTEVYSWAILYEVDTSGAVTFPDVAHSELIDDEPGRHITGSEDFIETGHIIALPHNSVPPGYLECNGAAVSTTTYSALFSVLGYTSGNPGGGNFNIPDYRGAFLRGWAHGFSRDPDRASRIADQPGGATGDNVGSFQNDEFRSHTHGISADDNDTEAGSGDREAQPANNTQSAATGGNETRPKNIYVMYCIKY